MSIFAGLFRLRKTANLSIISKRIDFIFKKKVHVELIKANLNGELSIFSESKTEGMNSILAGQLMLNRPENEQDLINDSFDKEGLTKLLLQSTGDFAGFKYFEELNQLILFTDKSGIRPLYYQITDDYLIFSTSFQLFVELNNDSPNFDTQAILEKVTLGYPLADKTILSNVKRLDSAQCLISTPAMIETQVYWNRKDIRLNDQVNESDIQELYESFARAIKKRITEPKKAVAFLSGGLDSRAITSQLVNHNLKVAAFNFGTKKSQDNEFARLLASSLDLDYYPTLFKELNFPNWSQLISDVIEQKSFEYDYGVTGKPVWSGDGGSVCVGGVYLNEEIQTAVKEKRLDKAFDIFVSQQKVAVPIRFLKPEVRSIVNSKFKKHIIENLCLDHNETDKAFYDFLVKNDQKRHLDNHFETIHKHRIDLKLPFFDADFLDRLYTFPVNELLFHKLYMKWFEYFPGEARSTPWQTYPGHEACPVKVTDSYSYQWDTKASIINVRRDIDIYRKFKKTKLFKQYFATTPVSIAMMLHKYKLKDFSYLIKIFNSLNK